MGYLHHMPASLRFVLISIAAILSVWFVAGYSKLANPFYGDGLGYYIYLPSTFIYHNHLALAEYPENAGIPEDIYLDLKGRDNPATRTPLGYTCNQYTYGVALMEAPAFLIAHAYVKLMGGQASGYSPIYQRFIITGNILYALLGLWLVYKILRRYFNPTHSFLSVLLIFICTNLFWFTLRQAGMAHIPLFFLYAALVWLTIKVHERPALSSFLAIGFVAGLITVIRPTDIICLLIPLLYNIYNRESIRIKWAFIRQHFRKILLMPLVFMIPIIPQLLYWKLVSSSYLYYSYGNQQFFWDNPKIIEGLFHFNNGWLAYSPVMIFSVLGLLLYRNICVWAWVLWLLLPLYIYIIYSWYCYNYINGLGSRPMIHMYPLLAIPLAAFLKYIGGRGKLAITAVAALCIFFTAVNFTNSIQQAIGILLSEESNFAFNSQMLFRTTNTYEDLVVYDVAEWQPDERKITKVATLQCLDFNDSLSPSYTADTQGYVYAMSADEEYHKEHINVRYDSKALKGAKWLKCSADFLCTEYPRDYFRHLFNVYIKRGDQFLKWKAMKVINKIGVKGAPEGSTHRIDGVIVNEWDNLAYYVRVPDDIQDGDIINLEVWNVGKQQIYFDNMCLEAYR